MGAAPWAAVLAFAMTVMLGPAVILTLRRYGLGQSVRPDGPKTHLRKTGIPTMGGILIVVSFGVASSFLSRDTEFLPYALLITTGFALIGLVDDFIIVMAKRSLGLRARHKLLAQGILGLVLGLYALVHPELGPSVLLPFGGGALALPPALFVVLSTAVVVGSANAVNLTDGLDGLAAGATALAASAYALVALKLENPGLAIFSAAVAGACIGFLWFNAHPAQVFMGDTGSLALGAALASVAVLTRTQFLLLLIGGLFALETLSVIVQVIYFRASGGRRVFRMSPLHHHFELGGWAETKVVARFLIMGIGFALLGIMATPRV